MNSSDKSAAKLLTRPRGQEHDSDDVLESRFPSVRIVNIAVALVTAAILAFVLLPRIPLLEQGEIAIRNITGAVHPVYRRPGA